MARFDEQPDNGVQFARMAGALIVFFAGQWLGELLGQSTGSLLIAGSVGFVTAVTMHNVLFFGDTAEASDASLTQPMRRIWTIAKLGLIIAVGGYVVVRIVQRFIDSPTYEDSTVVGLGFGVIFAAAFAHWRQRRVFKRQQSS